MSAVRQEGIQRVKTWIEVAAKLGAPVIRVFAQTWPRFTIGVKGRATQIG